MAIISSWREGEVLVVMAPGSPSSLKSLRLNQYNSSESTAPIAKAAPFSPLRSQSSLLLLRRTKTGLSENRIAYRLDAE